MRATYICTAIKIAMEIFYYILEHLYILVHKWKQERTLGQMPLGQGRTGGGISIDGYCPIKSEESKTIFRF